MTFAEELTPRPVDQSCVGLDAVHNAEVGKAVHQPSQILAAHG
jgi:hypothetical protein